ncbi:MAG: YwaF family protein [Clostridia bacterium]
MLFDVTHCLYIVISLAITVGILILCTKIKKQKYKDMVLLISGVLTFGLHISYMWWEFFTNKGSASAPDNILFPIYFCNLCMYMLMFVSCINKESKFFKWTAIFTAYGGTFGALISLFYPDYYLQIPDLANWGVLKSMLSHSAMLIGCLYLFTGGYVKIKITNIIPYATGLLCCGVIGFFENYLFAATGVSPRNAMYLQKPPIEDLPILNCYTIALLMLIIIFIFALIYEKIKYKKLITFSELKNKQLII